MRREQVAAVSFGLAILATAGAAIAAVAWVVWQFAWPVRRE